ncbi:hypothetical protein ON010_g17898 [Phytophthora cinnamomi]|nr:hypothetical protein ON010_g17898 [Phytophthora cinnamomi]
MPSLCGTPGFVAPEILSAGKGEAYPSGVDMFSAGVVAYTMLCGYEPFFGVNDEELIQMNKRVDYEFEEPEWASISDEAKDMASNTEGGTGTPIPAGSERRTGGSLPRTTAY